MVVSQMGFFCGKGREETYKDPGPVIRDSKFKTVRDGLVAVWDRDSITSNAGHSHLSLLFGKEPGRAAGLGFREVGQDEHGSESKGNYQRLR